jgi:hypothetical protein
MSKAIHVPEDTFKRLQALAEPFSDTPASVIERLLDAHDQSPRALPPGEPPRKGGAKEAVLDDPLTKPRPAQPVSVVQLGSDREGEPAYMAKYRRGLDNPNHMITRILAYMEKVGTRTREKLQQACVRDLGYTSTKSGSINACIGVLELDGYLQVEGKAPHSTVRFVRSTA